MRGNRSLATGNQLGNVLGEKFLLVFPFGINVADSLTILVDNVAPVLKGLSLGYPAGESITEERFTGKLDIEVARRIGLDEFYGKRREADGQITAVQT